MCFRSDSMKTGRRRIAISALHYKGWECTEMRELGNDFDKKRIANYAEPKPIGKDIYWVWEVAVPIVFVGDGGRFFVGDGFHRILAAEKAGRKEIDCEVKIGSERDAWLYNIEANKEAKGMDWKPGDKAKSARKLLTDPECAKWPLVEMARFIGCSVSVIADVRRLLPNCKKRINGSSDTVEEHAAKVAKAQELKAQGLSQRCIAELLKTTQGTISNWLGGKKKPRPVQVSSKTTAIIVAELASGKSQRQIAEDIGKSHAIVRHVASVAARTKCRHCHGSGWIYEDQQ